MLFIGYTFCQSQEEDENNNEELIAAWKLILRNHVRKIFDLLLTLTMRHPF